MTAETAKDILEKHRRIGAVNIPLEDALLAMQEIAEMTYDRFNPRIPEDCNCELCEMRRRKKSIFMKSLFPPERDMKTLTVVPKCVICDPLWAASTMAPLVRIDCVCQCGVEQKVESIDNGYVIHYLSNGEEIFPSIFGDSSPVSSGTPCTFNIENPDRVEPL